MHLQTGEVWLSASPDSDRLNLYAGYFCTARACPQAVTSSDALFWYSHQTTWWLWSLVECLRYAEKQQEIIQLYGWKTSGWRSHSQGRRCASQSWRGQRKVWGRHWPCHTLWRLEHLISMYISFFFGCAIEHRKLVSHFWLNMFGTQSSLNLPRNFLFRFRQ